MTPSEIQRLSQAPFLRTDRGQELPTPRMPAGGVRDGGDFSRTLKSAVEQVDDAQKGANSQVSAFVAGEQENVHEVMLAMEEAKLSFQLMVEVRNRMMETYQELMRMQV